MGKGNCISIFWAWLILAGPFILNLSSVSGAIIDFDDLPEDIPAHYKIIPDGYHGFEWSGTSTSDGPIEPGYYSRNEIPHEIIGMSGFGVGIVSENNAAFFPTPFFTSPNFIEISGDPFDFLGVHVTSAWRNDLIVNIQGFRNDTEVYNIDVKTKIDEPNSVRVNWERIDKLRLESSGGTPGYPEYGTSYQFILDDLEYDPSAEIPAPGAFVLVSSGIVLTAFRRRRLR